MWGQTINARELIKAMWSDGSSLKKFRKGVVWSTPLIFSFLALTFFGHILIELFISSEHNRTCFCVSLSLVSRIVILTIIRCNECLDPLFRRGKQLYSSCSCISHSILLSGIRFDAYFYPSIFQDWRFIRYVIAWLLWSFIPQLWRVDPFYDNLSSYFA